MYKHFRTKLSVLGGVIILDNMQRYLSILHFLKSNNNDKETHIYQCARTSAEVIFCMSLISIYKKPQLS